MTKMSSDMPYSYIDDINEASLGRGKADKDMMVTAKLSSGNVGRTEQSHEHQNHLTARSIVVMFGVVGTYYASMLHLTGSGLLAQTIAGALYGSSETTWITLSLIIVPATLGPAISMSTDFWGRKWLITATMIMGFIGTIVVSRAQTIATVIAGQTVAGFGQISQALTHAIVSEIMPRKYRPYAQTAVQLSVGLAAITALYSGGAMCTTDPEGFRNYFYMTAAVFFCSAFIVAFLYKPPSRELQKLSLSFKILKFDTVGTILTIIGFLGICIGLGWSQNPYSWKSVQILVPFLIGICSMCVLTFYATKVRTDGIWHRDFLQSRNFVIAAGCIFAEGFLFVAFNNWVPFQISFLYDKNLFDTGLEYSIAWYMVPVGATISGFYATSTGHLRPQLMLAYVLMVAFYGALASTNTSSDHEIYGLVVLFGLALGTAIPALVIIAQLSVPPKLIATVTGLMLATRAMGGTVGLAVYNAIFNSAISRNLPKKVAAIVLPLGLPETSLTQLLGAILSNDHQALEQVPGITPQIIRASLTATKDAFQIGFRDVYIMSSSVAAVCILASLFVKSLKVEFTTQVDAPLQIGQIKEQMES